MWMMNVVGNHFFVELVCSSYVDFPRFFVFQEQNFLARLQDNQESSLRRLNDTHKEKIALLDRQFLQQKQQLMRAREAAIWEMEERQLHEKHQLAKRQLKDLFFLQRHQMLVRIRPTLISIVIFLSQTLNVESEEM